MHVLPLTHTQSHTHTHTHTHKHTHTHTHTSAHTQADEAGDDEPEGDQPDDRVTLLFRPRSYCGLYRGVLKGCRLWKRPPNEYCDRCAECLEKRRELEDLTAALTGKPDTGGLVASHGGERGAWAYVVTLQLALQDLNKHVAWSSESRRYVKHRETNLRWDDRGKEVLLYLDYGGMTDSRGSKCSVWSACAMAKGRQQEHFDFHFDAANQHHSLARGDGPGHKKDGEAGIYFLGALLDKKRWPGNADSDKALLQHVFPGATHILLSGDTGNGFRAYEMLDELSSVLRRYGYFVELMPLGPGHAYNRTDARLARQNTFLAKLTRESRVFGSRQIAEAFRIAASGGVAQRKFMDRSHIFYADVPVNLQRAASSKSWVTMGKGLGVRGLAYFRFYRDGVALPDGCAIVREYGDPTRSGNIDRLYCWRPADAKLLCQQCSNREV